MIVILLSGIVCANWNYLANNATKFNVDSNGNGVFVGNVTASNVHLPAYLGTNTNKTVSVAVASTWYNMSFDAHADNEKERVTHTYNDATNDTFTIVDTGVYRLSYGISFKDVAANPTNHVGIRLIKNGVEISGSVFEKDTTKQNAVGTLYRNCMVSLTANDALKLQFTGSANTISVCTEGTFGSYPTSSSMNIHRMG